MTATLTTVGGILKEVYGPRIEKQYTEELTALKRVERTSEGVTETAGGKYVDFPIKVSRNTGVGNRLEGEALPAAGRQGYSEVHVGLQYSYGRVRMNGQTMELAETNYQAFASATDEEMDGLKDDLAQNDARQVYGDGTGLLTGVASDGANNVVVTTLQYLEVGMAIDIINISTGAVLASNRLITAINESTNAVTYDGADVTATTAHGLFRQGNYGNGSTIQREVTGFARITDNDTVLHTVDPATVPKWKGVVSENGGVNRALSESLMIKGVDNIRTAGGGRPTAIFTSLGVRRSYHNLLVQQRRFTDTKEFHGGLRGLVFHHGEEIPVVDDPMCPANTMFFINEKKMKIYRTKPYHWMDTDNSIWKWVTDYDAWEALMKQYWEIGVSQRNSNGVIRDITEG